MHTSGPFSRDNFFGSMCSKSVTIGSLVLSSGQLVRNKAVRAYDASDPSDNFVASPSWFLTLL